MGVKAVIFDYGCVLCLDQPEEDRERIEALAGVDGSRVWPAYWEHRPAYDRGLTTGPQFWAAVAGQVGVDWDEALRARLIEADIASWSHLDERMIAWLEALAEAGVLVGLLSNAPLEIRDAILDRQPWARRLTHATFSCDVRSLKPEPEIYRHCLAGLGVDADSALFLDDRAVNVQGARRVGIRALRYVSAGELIAELTGADGLPPLPD